MYNLKIAFRNLSKNRLYSIISICGLAVSLATCSFILLWVQDEKSYDRFHQELDRIYQAITHLKGDEGVLDVNIVALSGKEISPLFWMKKDVWLIYGIMLLSVIILAGLYPAWTLASFQPAKNIRKKKQSVFAKTLIVLQFVSSVVFIITNNNDAGPIELYP